MLWAAPVSTLGGQKGQSITDREKRFAVTGVGSAAGICHLPNPNHRRASWPYGRQARFHVL